MDREQDIHSVYKSGVLRPEEAANLHEGTRGTARIRADDAPIDPERLAQRTAALAAIRRIGASGVFNSGGKRLTRDEMYERD